VPDRPPDWREPLLADLVPGPAPAGGRNVLGWSGYSPDPAVMWGLGSIGRHSVVLAAWDFATYGGSFGEADAAALAEAAELARESGRPLVTLLRSGGTRLQEGMAALVGIPRSRLALKALADAGVVHLSVCDSPTTGGVWISTGSTADLRVAVSGATVGFAGPRVVAAMTGAELPEGSHTAASAGQAGLVDAVLPGEHVHAWLDRALSALTATDETAPATVARLAVAAPTPRGGAEQVALSRSRTAGGAAVLAELLSQPVGLQAGDPAVAAAVGTLRGRGVVGVAFGAEVGARPGPAGLGLLVRAARLAGRLGLPLLTLVDTPGVEPAAEAEAAGVAAAIAAAMDAVLDCPSPTLALVHGEGGSGGALAAAVTDTVLVTEEAYFTALGPEGAAAALRLPVAEAVDRMGVTPGDLLSLGFADGVSPLPGSGQLCDAVAGQLAALSAQPLDARLEARRQRWSRPLPGSLPDRAAPAPD
jgi:acyl-CoA carboxylase subunit beta